MPRILLFTQPGCFSCELMRIYLEARRAMTETYDSEETPTLVVFSGETPDVVTGFDPARLDQFLDPAPSSDSVSES